MAKIKQYELYEGDGETIPGESAGPGAGSGRSSVSSSASSGGPEDDQWEMVSEEPEQKRRYFRKNEYNDGLGDPAPLFDDFDRFNGNRVRSARTTRLAPPKRNKRNQGGWTAVSVLCLLLLVAMGMLMLPQLTGIRHQFFPNYAFANGTIIELDDEKEKDLDEKRDLVYKVYADRIYPGVYIDGIDVSGMTREEAFRVVEESNEKVDTVYELTVSIGNEKWHINNERLPISRNTRDIVDKAWAIGRSDTRSFRDRDSQLTSMHSGSYQLETEASYDHEKLRETVEGIAGYVYREPKDSFIKSFDPNTKQFTFQDDVPGARLNTDELYTRLQGLMDDMLNGGVTHLTVRVEAERIEARYTKTELMNHCGLLATFTTETTKNANRNTNINLSAMALNGKAVEPGDIFSFNGATGERTAAKGYKEAAAIAGGQTRDEIGGGVCQTSSTLFNAVARVDDMEILERHPHAWPSNYIGKGYDATVNWPGLDFRFRNNSEFQVFIIASYAKQKVTVSLYGIKMDPDVEIDLESRLIRTIPKPTGVKEELNPSLAVGERKKTVSAREGYEVETWKIWKRNGVKVKEELLVKSTYKAYTETYEYNDGSQAYVP